MVNMVWIPSFVLYHRWISQVLIAKAENINFDRITDLLTTTNTTP